MSGHLLGVLEPSVVFQVNRDTGSPPGGHPTGVREGEEGSRCIAISFVIWTCVWPRTSASKKNDSERSRVLRSRDNTV